MIVELSPYWGKKHFSHLVVLAAFIVSLGFIGGTTAQAQDSCFADAPQCTADQSDAERTEPQFDCPVVDFILDHCEEITDQIPEDIRRQIQRMMDCPNMGVYSCGGTIALICIRTFTRCPEVKIF
ncbi:MAG: hypothetical protein KDD70_00315 [Bdellovibrionales bacterium]|nr:hypothetical protein [Bdellovibrionales bacterium]